MVRLMKKSERYPKEWESFQRCGAGGYISIAKKLANGFIRNGHDVINLSDRDVGKFNKSLRDFKGKKYLNTMIYETAKNYKPDLILLGHSYDIETQTIEKIKDYSKNTVISQWFEDHLADTGPDYSSNSKKLLKYDDFINLYSDILLAKRDINLFFLFCNRILDAELFYPELFIKLLKQNHEKIKPKYVDVIKSIIENPDQFKNNVEKNAKLASANICLAEYYKSTKEKSEQHYIQANYHISDMQRAPIYARQQMYLDLINYFKNFDDSTVQKKIDINKGKGLIFIVGMPRSGTTLTESILSTADDIVAGGEKVFFTNNLWSIFSDLKTNQKINPDFIEELGNRYMSTIELHRNNQKNFIDKMPANFLYYKFIKLALPGSKFIHVHRNPWDNAISLFKANYIFLQS